MKNTLVIIILCLIILLVFYFLINPKQYTRIKIVVATYYLPIGTYITSDMVTLKEFPKEYIQPGAIYSIKEVLEQITLIPIAQGEQVLANKISKRSFSLAAMTVCLLAPQVAVGLHISFKEFLSCVISD